MLSACWGAISLSPKDQMGSLSPLLLDLSNKWLYHPGVDTPPLVFFFLCGVFLFLFLEEEWEGTIKADR